jgi:hypothetical protein
MRTLIIYDDTGFIISQMAGDVREPVGIPFLWVEVPQGIYITRVDVSEEEHKPIYENFPKSEVTLLQEQVDALNIAIAEMLGV